MKPRLMFAALLGSVFLTAGSVPALADSAPPKPAEKQASIPFVDMGSIRNYQAVGRDALYIQDNGGKWYRATLMSDCFDLPFAQAIGFDVRGTNTLDRYATVVVRGQRCPLSSLVASDAPPKKADDQKAHGTHHH